MSAPLKPSTHIFRLPDLGEGLTEAGLVTWLVAVGDTITTDQPIAEVETAKSVVELPSPFAGVVTALHGTAGDTIDVGAPVLEVADPESASAAEGTTPDAAGSAASSTPEHEAYREEERAGSGNVLIGYGTTAHTTKGRRRPAAAHHRATNGTGESVDGLDVVSRERMSPLRRAVSAKLTRSRTEIPEATVWVDVDATSLWALRAQMAPEGGKAPSVTALLARFVLLALEDYPVLASRLDESGEELISFDGVNLGIAADTERGLLVPVVPRAHALTVEQLDAALRELTATARAGTMPPERLRGSTFTLNNYGGLGVDGSAAIINHPDVAILGIGRIIERPWVVDGAIIARRIVQLSLAFDHRVCDGGYAAGFLRRVTELIEHPLRAFVRV